MSDVNGKIKNIIETLNDLSDNLEELSEEIVETEATKSPIEKIKEAIAGLEISTPAPTDVRYAQVKISGNEGSVLLHVQIPGNPINRDYGQVINKEIKLVKSLASPSVIYVPASVSVIGGRTCLIIDISE